MWLLIRLCMLIGAGMMRLRGRFFPPKLNQICQGVSYAHQVNRNKGRKVSELIEIPFKSNVVFKFTRESFWDRFFKNIGFSEELQTRDDEFDQTVYISADHLGLFSQLRVNAEIRRLVMSLLQERVLWIACDGNYLSFSIRGTYDRTVVEEDAVQLYQKLQEKLPELGRRFEDPFVWKVLAAQVFIWSVAGYAIGALAEYMLIRHDNHLFPKEVIKLGMSVGLGISLIAFVGLWLAFRSSSRGHRILVESFLVLILTGPIASAQLVADVNRGLDKSLPKEIVRDVVRGDIRVTTSRRRTKTYHYYLIFPWQNSQVENQVLPLEMQVEKFQYDAAVQSKKVVLTVREGFLGLPWYSSINGVDNSPL